MCGRRQILAKVIFFLDMGTSMQMLLRLKFTSINFHAMAMMISKKAETSNR